MAPGTADGGSSGYPMPKWVCVWVCTCLSGGGERVWSEGEEEEATDVEAEEEARVVADEEEDGEAADAAAAAAAAAAADRRPPWAGDGVLRRAAAAAAAAATAGEGEGVLDFSEVAAAGLLAARSCSSWILCCWL